jgi:hypothetical protein
VQRRGLAEKYWSLAEAREMMPQGRCVGQLSIHESTSTGARSFMAKYPTDTFPKSASRSFDPEDPESTTAALRHVLGWVWKHHRRLTGEICPYDLGSDR